MAELTDTMFQHFQEDFCIQLQTSLEDQHMQYTNKEALRCFLLSMLANILSSRVAKRNNLKIAYLASSFSVIYFLTATTDQKPKFNFFVFDLQSGSNSQKPVLPRPSKENLIEMLLSDQLFQLLPGKKLPNANVVQVKPGEKTYQVITSKFKLNYI